MSDNKPLILITNDDGIDSPGIRAISKVMSEIAEIIIVAPDKQQSAVSSALTIQRPLKIHEKYIDDHFFGYAVDGTPADCVKLAFFEILDKKPDLVVSGINHGLNTSINVLYSGTVSGAFEGHIFGVNSIAISHASHNYRKNMSTACDITQKVASKLIRNQNLYSKILLNINVPDLEPQDIKGTKITTLSNSEWIDKYDKRFDPWGNTYFWFAGDYIINDTSPNCDDNAIKEGYISISPLQINFSNHNQIDMLRNFEEL